MTGTRTRITRLVAAVVFALPILVSGLTLSSLAAPSAEDVEAAKDKLARLQHEFELLAERYNDAKYRLALTERKLAEASEDRRRAEQKARAAEDRLAERAVQAYVGTGSPGDGLPRAASGPEVSDPPHLVGLGTGGRVHPPFLVGAVLPAARPVGSSPARRPDLLLLPHQPRRHVHRRGPDHPRPPPGSRRRGADQLDVRLLHAGRRLAAPGARNP